MHRVTITHNFETAHRLGHPDAPEKCRSIHGHSWWVTVTIEGPTLDELGMLVEFGRFKKIWRGFLDGEVDHHLAVRQGDPLAGAIRQVMPEARILELPFEPTTEQLARWLYERACVALDEAAGDEPPEGLRVAGVHLQETRVNAAEFLAPPRPA